MLRVYHSNRLDVLEALMEFIVERQRLDDPFQTDLQPLRHTGTLHQHHFSLKRVIQPLALDDKLHQRFSMPVAKRAQMTRLHCPVSQ
jgi:hypothetical protein